MKKTCANCRAYSSIGLDKKCDLGFMITDGINSISKPLENCPKPKTFKLLIILLSEK